MGFRESVVSEVFGGEVRCVLQRQGAKESATVEPFFSLQLDIQSGEVWSLQDALVCLATREAVQMNSGTQNEVDAHRRQSLARLPMVLVLHLKRFLFDKTGGSQKLMKQVSYKIDLEVVRDLLAPSIRGKVTNDQRTYKLWAVVYHHGKSAVGGHYTCDVRHTGSGVWLRMDDSIVKSVPEEAVLKQPQTSNKVAYLLFYRRADCARTS
ncbi:Ubiquitin carboxyl-terminal hydrolase 10-A [Geodia barretti]|nr:Ubiquitin carboxyl-terminal hydrolase 10-A [Geodia barretti]